MKANLNILYRVIKSHAHDREVYYNVFRNSNHQDAARVWNFHNHLVRDCVVEYFKNGGKRPVGQYLAEDK